MTNRLIKIGALCTALWACLIPILAAGFWALMSHWGALWLEVGIGFYVLVCIVLGILFDGDKGVARRELADLGKPDWEVKQHEFAVERGMTLGTAHVLICTAWVGVDSHGEVTFVCHFDTPQSTDSMPAILQAIRDKSGHEKERTYRTYLVGGTFWSWSSTTRALVRAHVSAATDMKIEITSVRLRCFLPPVKYEAFSIGPNGELGTFKPSDKAGWINWKLLTKPMIRVGPSSGVGRLS